MDNIIVVIPARGGSKGIPRKNLRPLNGCPLIYYAISAARRVDEVNAVIVTTDDDEIGMFAERFGARVYARSPALSGDAVPLDPVIADALATYESEGGDSVDLVITVQPTSPLIEPADLSLAIKKLRDGARSVISVVEDKHLTWTRGANGFIPEYAERVNRQLLPDRFKETGAVIACHASALREQGTRIAEPVDLLVVPHDRGVDIDSLRDMAVAEFLLRRERIDFVVVGDRQLGLGHAFRALMIAHELVSHECRFWCPAGSEMAAQLIERHNFQVRTYEGDRALLHGLAQAAPSLVINDRLDTSADYVVALKRLGCKVVNFEDMGHGAEVADLVINALYPHQLPLAHVRVGAPYFCLRDEFLHGVDAATTRGTDRVSRVLVTFGGTDEENLTLRVLNAIGGEQRFPGVLIDVVVGPGYARKEELEARVSELRAVDSKIQVSASTKRISDHMAAADLAFSSAGRTVFELTSLQVPTVVLCQNARETTHSFASAQNGFVNLGLGLEVASSTITDTFSALANNPPLRNEMKRRMAQVDLRQGKIRVTREILDLVEKSCR